MICAGLALAAACGFRVFVPLLGMGAAVAGGVIEPSSGWEWVGSMPALIVLGVATAVEVAAYYVPWVDNLLDTVATPAAIGAGTIVAGAVLPMDEPWAKWTLAALGGGGVAGVVQAGTVLARAVSTGTTGGFGNFTISTAEWVSAVVAVLLAILVPIVAAVLIVLLVVFIARNGRRVIMALTGRRTGVATPVTT